MKRKTVIAIALSAALIAAVIVFQIFRSAIHRTTSAFFHPFIGSALQLKDEAVEKTFQQKTRDELIREVSLLKKENEKLQIRIELLNSIKNEKKRVEELLKITPTLGYKCIFAEIYLRDPAFWYESLSINKGAEAGITDGAIVLCKTEDSDNLKHSFAVLGRITEVTKYSSQVQTIISRTCNLSVIIGGSKAAGILKGGTIKNDLPYIKIAYLPLFKKYKSDAAVYTSGFCRNSESEISGQTGQPRHSTPGGLFIGTLSGKVKIVNNLNAEAEVIPAVNFNDLQYVIILVPEKNRVETAD